MDWCKLEPGVDHRLRARRAEREGTAIVLGRVCNPRDTEASTEERLYSCCVSLWDLRSGVKGKPTNGIFKKVIKTCINQESRNVFHELWVQHICQGTSVSFCLCLSCL